VTVILKSGSFYPVQWKLNGSTDLVVNDDLVDVRRGELGLISLAWFDCGGYNSLIFVLRRPLSLGRHLAIACVESQVSDSLLDGLGRPKRHTRSHYSSRLQALLVSPNHFSLRPQHFLMELLRVHDHVDLFLDASEVVGG
jgi:hypothetical protein